MQLHQSTRIAPVLDQIRQLPPGPVLDLGSGHATVAPYLPDREVTAVEYQMPDDLRAQLEQSCHAVVDADARCLPFPDGAFDVSVAVDVLEHIPPDGREAVLSELVRVTRRRIIVVGPTGPEAREADAKIAEAYGELPVWLREHREYGVPDLEDLTGPLEQFGRITVMPNANARTLVWTMTKRNSRVGWRLIHELGMWCEPALHGRRRWLLRAARGFDKGRAYRQMIVVDASRAPKSSQVDLPAGGAGVGVADRAVRP